MTESRVMITGGAGLIGSHIAELLAAGYNGFKCEEIVVIDDFSRGLRSNLDGVANHCKLTLIEGDIRDKDLVNLHMQEIDFVFHQAALRITQCAEEPRLAHEVLIDGTFNVIEAAAAAKVKKLVLASSASVYGLAEEFPTTERHHCYDNKTLYGAAKIHNEAISRAFHEMYGLDYVALRYFNVYGQRMDIYGVYTEVFIRWMERIAAGESPLIFGDGEQTMDFVNARDIARANILAAQSTATDIVLNVASGTETSLNDLARALCDAMGANFNPEHREERKVNPVSRRLAEVDNAANTIGFRAEISLDDGLKDLVAWWHSEKQA